MPGSVRAVLLPVVCSSFRAASVTAIDTRTLLDNAQVAQRPSTSGLSLP